MEKGGGEGEGEGEGEGKGEGEGEGYTVLIAFLDDLLRRVADPTAV